MSRHVTVASISCTPTVTLDEDMDKLLDEAAHYAWRARQFGADIVAFPETYPQIGAKNQNGPAAVELPDPTTERMMAEAKKLGMYIIWPLWTREGDTTYNSAVLIVRWGEISGLYHKMHTTITEIDEGSTPGTGASVFQSDFVKIGLAIC